MEIATYVPLTPGSAPHPQPDLRPADAAPRDDPRGTAATSAVSPVALPLPAALPAPLSQAATVSQSLLSTVCPAVAGAQAAGGMGSGLGGSGGGTPARVLKPFGVPMLPVAPEPDVLGGGLSRKIWRQG